MLSRVADLAPELAGEILPELAATGLVEIRSDAGAVRDTLGADGRARLHLAAARELGT